MLSFDPFVWDVSDVLTWTEQQPLIHLFVLQEIWIVYIQLRLLCKHVHKAEGVCGVGYINIIHVWLLCCFFWNTICLTVSSYLCIFIANKMLLSITQKTLAWQCIKLVMILFKMAFIFFQAPKNHHLYQLYIYVHLMCYPKPVFPFSFTPISPLFILKSVKAVHSDLLCYQNSWDIFFASRNKFPFTLIKGWQKS